MTKTLSTSEQQHLKKLEVEIERGLAGFLEVGSALLVIRNDKLYRHEFKTFEAYCRTRWDMDKRHANRLIQSSEVSENLGPAGPKPTHERQVRPLAGLPAKAQREIWETALKIDPSPTEELVQQLVDQYKASVAEPLDTFNQVNANIGWARWSWNPVTGCLHNCDYCYARDIANRFYPTKFDPTFYPERLEAPANTKLPKNANGNPEWRRVFTCSMADLFGKWVKQKWIDAIFERIQVHQEWEFLCLTKFPQRLAELDWPANVWAGTTVDRQHRVETAERSFAGVKAGVKWLSCEPLLEPLKFESLAMFDWVVIGASTGSTLVEPFAPPFEWVVDLYEQAKASGCKVYLKHNLFGSADGRTPGMQPVREWPR